VQPLTISIVQTATHWHDPEANRQMFDRWFGEVASDSALVVLPEMCSTGFTMSSEAVAESMDGPTVAWLRGAARELGKAICCSVVIGEGGLFYNRLIWTAPDGTLTTYDKRHLFRMAEEHEHYAAGGEKAVVQLAGWRICPLVCYDLRFPVWFRNRGDYDIFLCVANWPAARQAAWNTLLRARAIENQVFAVGCNIVGTDGNNVAYGGGSAVYGPDGTMLVEVFDSEKIVEVALDHEVLESQRRVFPVWRDADQFTLDMEK
jgi:predicted amidohydrolase